MSKYLQIQIPKPCHENWNNMDPAKQGRHCNACQKNVVDFTLMSDNDLVNFFKKNATNVCGRFTANQLQTDIPIPAKKIHWLKYVFQVAIPAFLFSQKVNAQTINESQKIVNVDQGKTACDKIVTLGKITIARSRVITGKVTDEDNKPIPYASIMVKGLSTGTTSDSNGLFKITVPVTNQVLQLSSLGFSSSEIDCRNLPFADTIKAKLTADKFSGMLGMVVVTTKLKKKKSLSLPAFVKPNTVSPSFSIFPNPTFSNSKLNIKWKDGASSGQLITIYNLQGEVLQQESLTINKSLRQSIEIKQLPAGTYIIQITDRKTKKSSSQQFIVQ